MKKVVLITGGSRGIGRACVELFARRGDSVLFFCRRRADLAEALVQALRAEGCDADWYQCDVSNKAEVDAAVADILRRYHRIDALINNALEVTHRAVADACWQEAETVASEAVPFLYISRPQNCYLVREGLVIPPLGKVPVKNQGLSIMENLNQWSWAE